VSKISSARQSVKPSNMTLERRDIGKSMKEQWDEIAHENAFYGVLSIEDFEHVDAVDFNRFWDTGRRDVDSFMEMVGLSSASELAMVEIGCGLGRMTHRFAELFRKAYAVEVSSRMLEGAKGYWQHLDNIEWVLGNGEDLHQIENESVDFVFSFMVLQHIPDPNIAVNYIRESARIMKKGASAFLQFRTVPRTMSLLALKYYIATNWPSSVAKPLRRVWDMTFRQKATRARFAREYESWRGCVIKPSLIDAIASEVHLQIKKVGRLGEQYTYYVFLKK